MARITPATLALTKLAIPFELRFYAYEPGAERIGLQAAEALGEPPSRVLKTLVAQVDAKPVCLVLASDREASLKKVAAMLGGKSGAMLSAAQAERITGYKVGGVSPFGQRRKLPTLVDESSLAEPYIFVNGGRRGLQIRLAPSDLTRAAEAVTAAIAV